MVFSGTGGCPGWQYPVLMLVLVVQAFTVLIQPVQPFQVGFLGFTHALPSFCTLTFSCHSIPHHPPNVSIPNTTSLVQPARFLSLFSGNFYKQQLPSARRLLNTVKWYTFCVISFACSQFLAGYGGLKSLKLSCNFQYAIWNGFSKSNHIMHIQAMQNHWPP